MFQNYADILHRDCIYCSSILLATSITSTFSQKTGLNIFSFDLLNNMCVTVNESLNVNMFEEVKKSMKRFEAG